MSKPTPTFNPRDLDEIFDRANDQEDPVAYLKKHVKETPLVRYWVEQATNDVFAAIDLPSVNFKPNGFPREFAGARLLNRIAVNTFADLLESPKIKVIENFLNLLDDSEAKLLLAIMDKNVSSLYPKLTHEVLCAAL